MCVLIIILSYKRGLYDMRKEMEAKMKEMEEKVKNRSPKSWS